jgi:hypothetical protein
MARRSLPTLWQQVEREMNAKKAKRGRRYARDISIMLGYPDGATYFWIKRPDGSVVRQLQPNCGRAIYQWMKGKGHNRVHAR